MWAGSFYNGEFNVTGIISANQFRVAGTTYDPGYFTNDTSQRTTSLPTFQKLQGNTNLYIYDVQQISEYVTGEQDGVYYLTGLSSDNTPKVSPFNDSDSFSFSQPVRDLYPQYDRDNPVSDPEATSSYALPQPLGEVVVDDVRKSVTKETQINIFKDSGVGIAITDIVSNSVGTAYTIFTSYDHGMDRLTGVSIASSGAGYGNGTGGVENLYNATLSGSSTGFNAYKESQSTLLDKSLMLRLCLTVLDMLLVTPCPSVEQQLLVSPQATVTVNSVTNNIGDSLNIAGVSSVGYKEYNNLYRITGISSVNQIQVESIKPINGVSVSGVGSVFTSDASVFTSGVTQSVSSIVYNNEVGLATVTVAGSHGFRVGNVVNLGGADESFWNDQFAITENVGLSTFVLNVGVNTSHLQLVEQSEHLLLTLDLLMVVLVTMMRDLVVDHLTSTPVSQLL